MCTDLVRQEYALRQPLPSPIIATLKSSAAQTDTERKTHPDAVRPWSTFEEEVNLHVAEIPTYPGSKPRFCQIAGDAQQVCLCLNIMSDVAFAPYFCMSCCRASKLLKSFEALQPVHGSTILLYLALPCFDIIIIGTCFSWLEKARFV